MKKCSKCGKETSAFFSSNDTVLCKICAEEVLVYSSEIDTYVYEEDYRDVYSKEKLADIEKFEEKK
jgi:hypothetical protein